jgi:serine/threonine-protein kinase
MAPEQLENSAAATASADIYALGAILYEALTGVVAHGGDALEEIMFDILHRKVPPASEHRALPPALDDAVARALSHEPAQRFPSIEAFAAALAPFGALDRKNPPALGLDDSTLNESNHSVPTGARVPRRSRSLLWAGATALCVGSAIGWSARGLSPAIAPERHSYGHPAPAKPPVSAVLAPAPSVTAERPPTPPAPAAPTTSAVPANARSAPAHSHASREHAQPAAPHATETGIVDRFDAKDPYE